jgi:hypothetical protein
VRTDRPYGRTLRTSSQLTHSFLRSLFRCEGASGPLVGSRTSSQGPPLTGWPFALPLENFIASTSIFVDRTNSKLQRANGGCLGVYYR